MKVSEIMTASEPYFRYIDLAFARFMVRLSPEIEDDVRDGLFLAAVLTSHTTTGQRHICLDLREAGGRRLADVVAQETETGLPDVSLPEPGAWRELLVKSPVVAEPGTPAPLILDEQDRLYLYRYWWAEQTLAADLRNRMTGGDRVISPDVVQLFASLFSNAPEDPDHQRIAAVSALTRRLTVITGGPGTGKTHTVGAIIGLLLTAEPGLRIALAAPTGKAAARLTESVEQVRAALPLPDAVREQFPEPARTLHRLLGIRPGDAEISSGRILPVDAVIVDEASMVSMPLMARLMGSVPETALVILLGDRHQLASVEAGAVLADMADETAVSRFSPAFARTYEALCGVPFPNARIDTDASASADGVVELQYSYRFAHSPGIGRVSRAVNSGDAESALAAMDTDDDVIREPALKWEDLEPRLTETFDRHYRPVAQSADPASALQRFSDFRILCAHHGGPGGVTAVNRFMTLAAKTDIGAGPGDRFYKGQPLLIMENDPAVRLFNGDAGMIWPDEKGDLKAWFADGKGGLRAVAIPRLPAHEPAYAMTVHKSQGSEFDTVLFSLPEAVSPLCTRELIYTGITRAKNRVRVWTDKDVFRAAVAARVERRSGLKDAIRRSDG